MPPLHKLKSLISKGSAGLKLVVTDQCAADCRLDDMMGVWTRVGRRVSNSFSALAYIEEAPKAQD